MKTALATVLVLFASACGGTPEAGPRATVALRDGTRVKGIVTSSSATEIRITSEDNTSRAIPMSQVRSVDYGESAAVPAEAPASQTASSAPDEHHHPVESAVTTTVYELASGTEISVRNEETIDSGRGTQGQTFAAGVTRNVLDAAGKVVIPDGANAQIVIRSASGGGRFEDASDLVLDLATVSVDGRRYDLSTVDLTRRGREGVGRNKRTATFAGGSAAIGAIIGAIAGGKKGAAIGAGSGAGGGVLAEVLTKGGSIKVPPDTTLTFKLDRPLRVVAAR